MAKEIDKEKFATLMEKQRHRLNELIDYLKSNLEELEEEEHKLQSKYKELKEKRGDVKEFINLKDLMFFAIAGFIGYIVWKNYKEQKGGVL